MAFGVAGACVYLFVPPLKGNPLFFNGLGLTSWIAVIYGIRRNRPSYALPWWLFALGLFLFWVGDVYTYSVPRYILHHEVPFPSFGDAVYLTVYVALMLGLVLLVRRRNPRRDRSTLIDASILTLGLALLSWMLLIAPYLHDGTLGLLPKLVSVAYPVGDIMLLAAAVRLSLDGGRRGRSYSLLGTSIVAVLVTDFIYGVMTREGAFHRQLWLDAGWFAFQLLWGAAALHPSMADLSQLAKTSSSKLTPVRLGMLAGASLIAPACILTLELGHGSLELMVIICASFVLFGLVVMRMADLARKQGHSVERERDLALEASRLGEEVNMQRAETRFASLVQNSSELITVVGPDATITYQSPSCEHVLGYTQKELLGTRFDRLVAGGDDGRLMRLLADGYAAGDSEAIECTLLHRDGESRQFEILHTNLLDDEQVHGIVLNGRDVSERKAFERQLEHQAFHDPLTALANRALFIETARHAIVRARREERELGLVFLDIDDFKAINDTLGRAAGDAALIELAKRVSDSLRSSDTAARFAGDEFVILLEDLDGVQTAVDVAERLLGDLERPLTLAGRELNVGASIGISILERGSSADAEELIEDADAAMYTAKREERGGYRLFEPEMHDAVLARLELRAELEQALEEEQFELYYQPIVRLVEGKVVGVEALLRWHHPEHGIVAPLDFIPFAEETGQIVQIGRWALREACRQAVALQGLASDEQPLNMCVNLSVRQLVHKDIVSHVRDALLDAGLDPHLLMLEITESMLIENPDAAVATLMELRALGVRIAMDDFGTGYSSLSYLSRFPLDVIKMDRSFLWPDETQQGATLASAIVTLGGSLGLRVVAEGIELKEQMEHLRDIGCGYGQGYFFARPMERSVLVEYLAEGSPQARAERAAALDRRASLHE